MEEAQGPKAKLTPPHSSVCVTMGETQSSHTKEEARQSYIPKLGWEFSPFGIVRPIVKNLVCLFHFSLLFEAISFLLGQK